MIAALQKTGACQFVVRDVTLHRLAGYAVSKRDRQGDLVLTQKTFVSGIQIEVQRVDRVFLGSGPDRLACDIRPDCSEHIQAQTGDERLQQHNGDERQHQPKKAMSKDIPEMLHRGPY